MPNNFSRNSIKINDMKNGLLINHIKEERFGVSKITFA